MGGYLARKKVIAVKMRHVRQSSFVHKRSIHFGFQANISVLGCLNHTTLTCPSAETERADSDVTSFFRMATSISSMECACHMLRSSRVSGWCCLMWNRSLSVRVSACVRKQTLALFHFPGQRETVIAVGALLSRSG